MLLSVDFSSLDYNLNSFHYSDLFIHLCMHRLTANIMYKPNCITFKCEMISLISKISTKKLLWSNFQSCISEYSIKIKPAKYQLKSCYNLIFNLMNFRIFN